MERTCREAVLAAFERLEIREKRDAFYLKEIIAEVMRSTSKYAESSIRTHITSLMCVQAPNHHGRKFNDFDRIDTGLYRRHAGTATSEEPKKTNSRSIRNLGTVENDQRSNEGNSDFPTAMQVGSQNVMGERLREERRIAVSFEIGEIGYIEAHGGKLLFPTAPAQPGVYIFNIRDKIYVGESDGLKRRFQHYRTPGPTQHTNIRINAAVIGALQEGFDIKVSTITEALVEYGDTIAELDFSKKSGRLLVENAVLTSALLSGLMVENL
jgi:hypothetical protein